MHIQVASVDIPICTCQVDLHVYVYYMKIKPFAGPFYWLVELT